MADMGLSIGRRRAVIKSISRSILSGINAFFKDMIFVPEFLNFFLTLYKLHICRYFAVHETSSCFLFKMNIAKLHRNFLWNQKSSVPKQDGGKFPSLYHLFSPYYAFADIWAPRNGGNTVLPYSPQFPEGGSEVIFHFPYCRRFPPLPAL